MSGDRQALRPAGERRVDLPDVALVLVLGVAALRRELGALRRVVEVGQAGVVELQVGAAERRDAVDLRRVRRRQPLPERVLVRVDGRVDRGGAAAVVDHRRRRDGQLGRLPLPHDRAQVGEVGTEDRFVDRERRVDVQPGRAPLDRAVGVPEPDHGALVGDPTDARDRVDEVHVPGGAAQLAVGRSPQADLRLHPDDVGDGLVLDGAQLRRVDLSGCEARAGGVQVRRPQETPDVVGTERWTGRVGHVHHSAAVPAVVQPVMSERSSARTARWKLGERPLLPLRDPRPERDPEDGHPGLRGQCRGVVDAAPPQCAGHRGGERRQLEEFALLQARVGVDDGLPGPGPGAALVGEERRGTLQRRCDDRHRGALRGVVDALENMCSNLSWPKKSTSRLSAK